MAQLEKAFPTNDCVMCTISPRLVEAGRSWGDRLKNALIEAGGEEAGLQRFVRYEEAFPVAYTEAFSAHAAVYDIGCVDQALHTGILGMNLYHPIEAGEDAGKAFMEWISHRIEIDGAAVARG